MESDPLQRLTRTRVPRGKVWFWTLLAACGGTPLSASGQIALDGTLPNGRTDSLAGPDYDITSDLGEQVGRNLFHSFRVFSLRELGPGVRESATFYGPDPTSVGVDRVIARVTEQASSIAGAIRTDDASLGGADLYLINPHGITFEDGSTLDVGGSFVASTAHNLQLAGGGVYDAVNPSQSLLTPAVPSAFGFLDPAVAPIAPIGVFGADTRLTVAPGRTLALVGGDVEVTGATIGHNPFGPTPSEPGIDIAIGSVASAGEVGADPGAPAFGLDVDDVPVLGNVTIGPRGIISSTGTASGAIWIRGEKLVLDNGAIDATTYAGDGAPVDLGARGGMVLDDQTCSPVCRGSVVGSQAFGAGAGPDVHIEAASLRVAAASRITTSTRPLGGGQAGEGGDLVVDLGAGALEVVEASRITTASDGPVRGGDVSVSAGSIRVSGEGVGQTEIRTSALGGSGSVGGTLDLEASGRIEVVDGGRLETFSGGAGVGGAIVIDAGHLEVSRTNPLARNALIRSLTTSEVQPGVQTGGPIQITAGSARIGERGFITSDVDRAAVGRGGDVVMNVAGDLVIETDPDGPLGGIQAQVCGSGAICLDGVDASGGDIDLTANRLRVTAGFINTTTSRGGDAGDIDITVREGVLLDRGGSIRSVTTGAFDGGDVTIHGGDSTVEMSGWSFSPDWDAENFPEGVPQPGGILVQTQDGGGHAGSAVVDAGRVHLSDGAQILSNTFGDGDGGDILIRADEVELEGFNARARQELAGLGITDPGSSATGLRADAEALPGAPTSTGDAGDITVRDFSLLRIGDDAVILAESTTRGDAGRIHLEGDRVEIFGTTPEHAPSIEASKLWPEPAGAPGDIRIVAHETFQSGNVVITTRGRVVQGGSIGIEAPSIDLGPGTVITSRSDGSGDAGSIDLEAGERIDTLGAEISTRADVADGGNIAIRSGGLVFLRETNVSAESLIGDGEGGNVAIEAGTGAVLGSTRVLANADGGPGGNIQLTAPIVLLHDTVLDASSETGIDGVVNINSPETNVVNALTPLPERYLEAADRVADRCAARRSGVGGSFVVSGRGAVPLDPAGPLPASSPLPSDETSAGATRRAVSEESFTPPLWTIDCATEPASAPRAWLEN